MKKICFVVILIAFGMGMVSCVRSTDNLKSNPEVDDYGVQIGTITNYYDTGCTVTVKKQTQTRTSFIDEVYEFSVEKPEKGSLRFIITMEEIPEENIIMVTQYDEFWNKIVAFVYTDKHLTDIIIEDASSEASIATRGWFGDLWDCSKARYKEIEKIIEDDDDANFWCGIVEYTGACTVSSVAISVIDCF